MPTFDQRNINGDEPGREWLGGEVDGVLASHGVFPEAGLVGIPGHLSWAEAACLPCAGLTAWNGLAGLEGLDQGSTILVQGTGGVSMMAMKLAAGTGARLILTSSSDRKLDRVRSMPGFESIRTINYRTTEEWEDEVLSLTDGVGVDVTIENGGGDSLLRSLKATARRGTVSCIGYLGGTKVDNPNEFLPLLIDRTITMRGINVGSRRDFERLCAFVEAKGIRFDAIIAREFDFLQAPAAFRHLQEGDFIGKVIINIPGC